MNGHSSLSPRHTCGEKRSALPDGRAGGLAGMAAEKQPGRELAAPGALLVQLLPEAAARGRKLSQAFPERPRIPAAQRAAWREWQSAAFLLLMCRRPLPRGARRVS